MDITKFSIDATIRGIRLICEEFTIKGESVVEQINTASNGIITKKQGVKRRVITLKGKVLSTDYISLMNTLDTGLGGPISVYVGNNSYPHAQIYNYSVNLKAGDKLADLCIELYEDNE